MKNEIHELKLKGKEFESNTIQFFTNGNNEIEIIKLCDRMGWTLAE